MFVLLAIATIAPAAPDGTLVYSTSISCVGRLSERYVGQGCYTHCGIIFDGLVYDSDLPRAHKTPLAKYGHKGGSYFLFPPITTYTDQQIRAMRTKAEAELGKPYQLRNYLRPGSRKTYGTWCSPYVGAVLNASGRYNLSARQNNDPQVQFNAIAGDHYFSRSFTIPLRRRPRLFRFAR